MVCFGPVNQFLAEANLIHRHDLDLRLQVDGGVSLETIERCAEAGADTFVAGSAVFGAEDPSTIVDTLRELAEKASA